MHEYVDIAKAALIVVGALVYFLMPVDLFPDMIPWVGRIDDLVVLLTALASALKLYQKLQKKD